MEREMEREMDKVMLVRTKNQLWKDLSWLMRRTYPTIVGEDPVIDAYTAPFMFMPEMPAMDGAADPMMPMGMAQVRDEGGPLDEMGLMTEVDLKL